MLTPPQSRVLGEGTPMIRAIAVGWIAQEVIFLGQTLIRNAYGWLRWSERHINSRGSLLPRSPSADAAASETEGCHSLRAKTYSARKS